MFREVANLKTLHTDGGSVPRVIEDNTQYYEDKSVELNLIMEFIDGNTLREIIDKGAIPIELAGRIALKIAETIRIAHKYPILHRDLKPDNIIVRDLDKIDIVIIDYGLSFNANEDEEIYGHK